MMAVVVRSNVGNCFEIFFKKKVNCLIRILLPVTPPPTTPLLLLQVERRSSNSWAEREFTVDILQSLRGNSESSIQDDAVLSKRNVPENKKVSNMVGVTAGEDSINSIKEEGNEQSSPVSILECPFDDEEEEENGSDFEDHLARVEGTKQKLMQKIRRFERLAQLEPMDLEKRIAMTELEDESLESHKCVVVDMGMKEFVVKILKNEMNPLELGQELEVNEGIKAYVKEMEKNEYWIEFNEEKEDIGSAVELELFGSLVDELLIDLFSQTRGHATPCRSSSSKLSKPDGGKNSEILIKIEKLTYQFHKVRAGIHN